MFAASVLFALCVVCFVLVGGCIVCPDTVFLSVVFDTLCVDMLLLMAKLVVSFPMVDLYIRDCCMGALLKLSVFVDFWPPIWVWKLAERRDEASFV